MSKLKELEERIKKDGRVLGEDVLKVDSFLTHQVDPELMAAMGQRFAEVFADAGITKVVSIEASGIAPAVFAAYALHVPMVFARKSKSITMADELITADVFSFTKQVTNHVSVSKKFLTSADTVLVVDDFLANGQAGGGLIDIVEQAGATIAGLGIVIEKTFQPGRQLIEERGIKVVSLARIAAFVDGEVKFAEADA